MIHVLNGDALAERFPKNIMGEIVVARMCMVDGDVTGENVEEIFESHMQFLLATYDIDKQLYKDKTISEIAKLQKSETTTTICFWFEDDLFCQINFWFCMYYLKNQDIDFGRLCLVRPTGSLEYGFGGMEEDALVTALEEKQLITKEHVSAFEKLWSCYQDFDFEGMNKIIKASLSEFAFLEAAIEALEEWKSKEHHPGKPLKTLKRIMSDLGPDDFGKVFRQFHQEIPIYGFGDIQVKKWFDELSGQL